ncbi:MAG: PaaI family thioesterase [Pseudomonadota bacterium]
MDAAEIPPGFALESGTDPAEDMIGPFYLARLETDIHAGMRVEPRHCNGMASVHGGVLLTFADFALCAQARYLSGDRHIVTVSLNSEFLDTAPVGAWLSTTGEVSRRTGRLVFVRGMIHHEGTPVLAYSGIGKRIK